MVAQFAGGEFVGVGVSVSGEREEVCVWCCLRWGKGGGGEVSGRWMDGWPSRKVYHGGYPRYDVLEGTGLICYRWGNSYLAMMVGPLGLICAII